MAAEIAYGARTSLIIGVGATLGAILFGAVVGGLAGYYRGWIGTILMRVTEFFQTIPAFVFAILIVAILQPSVTSEIVAIAAVSWPSIARLVRGEFAALGGREFVQACAGLGAGDARIIFRHLLPNCTSSIIAVGSLLIGTSILIEAGLAFLGLGDPNVMSWGLIISAGRAVLRSAWWICTFPGIAILLTVLGINLAGDGLNEALNPRLRGPMIDAVLSIEKLTIALPPGADRPHAVGGRRPRAAAGQRSPASSARAARASRWWRARSSACCPARTCGSAAAASSSRGRTSPLPAKASMRRVRGAKIAMIFQEPMTALNPLHRIGRQLDEVLRIHTELGVQDAAPACWR